MMSDVITTKSELDYIYNHFKTFNSVGHLVIGVTLHCIYNHFKTLNFVSRLAFEVNALQFLLLHYIYNNSISISISNSECFVFVVATKSTDVRRQLWTRALTLLSCLSACLG